MASFSVIIVTWNGKELLERFLPSVTATNYSDFEVIVADNCSNDGSMDWLEKNYPDIRIVRFQKNFGYCGGNNRAANYAKNDVLVFLNNDAGPDSEWLNHATRVFDENLNVAALQPKILSADAPAFFEYAGAAGGFLDKYGYPYCRGRIFDTVEQDLGQYNTPVQVFWASGAALFIRRDVFFKQGGFADSFEFHMEEIDLCWRIQSSGGIIWYCPDSIVYHLGGGSLNSENPRKLYYNFRNNLLMLVRNHPKKGLLSILMSRIMLDKIAMVHYLIRSKPQHSLAVFKALFGFLRLLPEAIRFRKLNNQNQNLTVGLSSYAVVYQYFIKNRKTYSEIQSHQ
jgi:GT2 family glycosyltransferase